MPNDWGVQRVKIINDSQSPVITGDSPPDVSNIIKAVTAAITDTNPANVVAADAGAGLRYYVTDIIVTNGDATVGTLVDITDSAGGVICSGYAASAGGGFSHSFKTAVPCGVNTHIHATCGTTSAEVYVSLVGYKAV